MNSTTATNEVGEKTRKVVGLQVVLMFLTSAAFFAGKGLDAAQAAVFGGLISIASTLLLGYGVKRAAEAAVVNPGKSAAMLYAGAAFRFMFILAAFAIGLAVLKLYPLGVFAGFAVVQMVYLVSMYFLRH